MVHVFMGMLFILLGYLIKYKQWSWLIAGYNTSSKKEKLKYDAAALCGGVGNFLFLLAGILFVTALGEIFNAARVVSLGWILFSVSTIAFLVYANTGNRYKKENK